DAELALGRLDGRINLAGRHVIAFRVELEMVDERFHRTLHGSTLWRNDLAVLVRNGSDAVLAEQTLHALPHDLGRLAHLLHADQIAVIAVAVLADRNIEIHLRVALVGLALAQVPWRTGTAHHHAREPPGPCVLERDHADIGVALLEDAV